MTPHRSLLLPSAYRDLQRLSNTGRPSSTADRTAPNRLFRPHIRNTLRCPTGVRTLVLPLTEMPLYLRCQLKRVKRRHRPSQRFYARVRVQRRDHAYSRQPFLPHAL